MKEGRERYGWEEARRLPAIGLVPTRSQRKVIGRTSGSLTSDVRLVGMTSADLLLHPVRLRIVKAFLGDRALTTSQLAAELDGVALGSLYRHVATLTKAGVLQVAAERRVRGAVERTYTLRLFAARIAPGAAAAMTADQHADAFMAYVAGMLADADRYLAAGKPDPARDGADYRVGAMWLTDAEFAEFLRDFAEIAQPRLANSPGEGRRRRMVYTVFLPAPEESPAAPAPEDDWEEGH
jgi:Helix-turn-helix domain